jgi:hypothetical protein
MLRNLTTVVPKYFGVPASLFTGGRHAVVQPDVMSYFAACIHPLLCPSLPSLPLLLLLLLPLLLLLLPP